MEAITTPRQWIKNIDKIIAEYKVVCKMLENCILNQRFFTQKETEQFVAFTISVDKLEIMDFYESLDKEPADKRNGKYQDFNFQLSQTIKNFHEHKFPESHKELHDFNAMDLRKAYRKIWHLVMNRLFELQNFYNCFLNPNFEGIDHETGKYIFKKHTWNINPNDPAESIRDFFRAYQNYFINLSSQLKNGLKVDKSKEMFDYGQVSLLRERAKVELETFITRDVGGIKFLDKHKAEVDELMCQRKDIIKEYKLNHADKITKHIDYFENTQLLCDYSDWLTIKVIPYYKETENDGIIDKSSLAELSVQENKFWKAIEMKKVIEHFTPLTTKLSKNNSPFLTEQQLISFLKRAFLFDLTQPKQKINFATTEKGFVIKRFYEFYALVLKDYAGYRATDPYIKMLTENFSNLGTYESIKSAFKQGKTKQVW
ncbi:MAG: hypothetical protein IPG07_12225 [Crocinitomicaceae bacterium]|nr:hypothetical protein [Crocinitomicaceae bacterium]